MADPAKNDDLHGNVPDSSAGALLLIDGINDLEFPGDEHLIEQALPMAERLANFKRRARRAGIPAIYVNDNFGKRAVGHVETCRALPSGRGTRRTACSPATPRA